MRALALALLVVVVPLSGCFGGEARTEWAFDVTQLSTLADMGRSGSGVVVAILDTGINPNHVALSHLFDGDRGNGEVIEFKDYVNHRDGVGNAYDDDGHGSHVAGIIAASGSSLGDKISYSGIDLLGGAPGVTLVIAKVCGPGSCNSQAIPDAINWAVSKHAQIISMSFGGDAALGVLGLNQDAMTQALNGAIAKGIVAVAAAGNTGPSNDDVSEPADIPDVIGVGAIQEDGTVWTNSSRGSPMANRCQPSPIPVLPSAGRCDPSKKPELVAPGVDILSSWTDDKYVRATGTSQATPFVTSAIALLLQGRAPLHNADDVRHLKTVLEQTARPVPGQTLPHDDAAGYGLLQAKAAYDAYRG
ncbi:MAG: S8 family serine peptidase [bacterium]